MTGLLVPVAVLHDQASGLAMRARSGAVRVEVVAGGLTAARHDPFTVAEASVVLDAARESAGRSEEASRATAVAADLAARIPPLGVDPELEREEFLTSFHEAGHAEYASRSRIVVPVSAEIDVSRGLFCGPRGRGMVNARFTKSPERFTERDLLELASLSLAGPVAEAQWRHRVEGARFDRAVQESYQTGGSSDYADACEETGGDRKALQLAERRARNVVIARWPNIVALSEILRDKERMSGGQIRRVA